MYIMLSKVWMESYKASLAMGFADCEPSNQKNGPFQSHLLYLRTELQNLGMTRSCHSQGSVLDLTPFILHVLIPW
jgi:hypothetical protein